MLKMIFSKIKKELDIIDEIPYNYENEYPVHFSIECGLVCPFYLFMSGSALLFGVTILDFFGVFESKTPGMDWSILATASLFMLALSVMFFWIIKKLLHRNITNEQYQWALSVYHELNMEKPSENMIKHELAAYVTAAYRELDKKAQSLGV